MKRHTKTAIIALTFSAVARIASAQQFILNQAEANAELRSLISTVGCDATTAARLRALIQPARLELERSGRKLALSEFVDPSITSVPGGVATNGATLEVTREGKTAGKAQIAWHLLNTTFNVTLAGPINEDAEGDAFAGGRLVSGAQWGVGMAHTFWSSASPAAAGLRSVFSAAECPLIAGVIQDEADALALSLTLVNLSGESRRRLQNALPNRILEAETLEMMADRAVASGVLTVSRAVSMNFQYGTTRTKFRFLTDSNVTPRSETKDGNETSGGIAFAKTHFVEQGGARYVWPQFSVGVGFRVESGFSSAPTRQICTAFGEFATQCQTIAIAGPEPTKAKELIADLRSWSYVDRLAVNGRYTRDFSESDTHRAEIKFTYLQLKKSGLTDGAPNYLLDNETLSLGARAGYVWDRKDGRPDEGPYFVIFFGASLGALSF